MFGAYFYGLAGRDVVKEHIGVSKFGSKLDMNDFMFSNSPYTFDYEKPAVPEPAEVHSDSPSSPPMTFVSPPQPERSSDRGMEVGPLVFAGQGVEGIDEYGTNTFDADAWMVTSAVRAAAPQSTAVSDETVERAVGLLNAAARGSVLPYASAPEFEEDEGMETDTEFDRQRTEQRTKRREERDESDSEKSDSEGSDSEASDSETCELSLKEPPAEEDVVMPSVSRFEDDVVMRDASEGANPPEGKSRKRAPPLGSVDEDGKPLIIDLGSDDDEADHPRESDDDDEDQDGPLKVKEMKPLVTPSGAIVKVERGYWKEEEDRRNRRIARLAAREEKDKELAAANAKLLQVQLDSQKQISSLSSQFEELKGLLQSQMSQRSTFAPSQSTMPPFAPVFLPPMDKVQHLMSGTSHPRFEDEGHVTSLAQEDIVTCTPLSQLPPTPLPEQKVSTSVQEVAMVYRRVDDVPDHTAGQSASLGVELGCPISDEALVEVPESSPNNDEEKVDYEGDSDDNVPEEADISLMAASGEQTPATDLIEVGSEGRGEVDRTIERPIAPPPRRKWLNIVFDLNGVLCHTVLKSYAAKMKPYKLEDNVLSHENPTIIGPKAVFARPNVGHFLRQVSEFACKIVVWTSMLRRNAEPIAGHLFTGCREPYDILGQEQCTKIELAPRKFFRQGAQILCMKDLAHSLLSTHSCDRSFFMHDTLLIDDSPEKSVLNESGNVVILETWSQEKSADDVLMGELLPWLRRLHSEGDPEGRLLDYVNDNRIEKPPLRRDDYHLGLIVEGMRESAKVMGTRWDVPALGSIIEQRPRRN